MDTIFINSENSKTADPYRLILNLSGKINLKRRDKYVALLNLLLYIYYTWKNIKKSYKNNKFEMSAPIWNEESELPEASYFVSDIQDYFEYIITKHKTVTDNPSIRIYVNKIENRITFKIKIGFYLELFTPWAINLLRSTKSKITKDENGTNLAHLEITEVVLVHSNIVNNDFQHDSRVFINLFPINCLVNYLIFHSKILYF